MKIFSLPHVAIYELLKHFKIVALISLSFCSKRAHAFVKTYSTIEAHLKIEYISPHGYSLTTRRAWVWVWVTSEAKQDFFDFPNLKTHQDFKYSIDECGTMYVCWEDQAVGCRWTTNYICDLLGISVSIVYLNNRQDIWLLDFAQQRQEQKLKEVQASTRDYFSRKGFSKIWKSNATELLNCQTLPPQNLRFNGKLPPVKTITMRYGSWITREHLLGLESQSVQIWDSSFSSADINALLRCWLSGGLPNLKFLNFDTEEFTDQTYAGFADRMERVERDIDHKWEFTARFRTNIYHLRRDDNVVATVMCHWRAFQMVVWPDSNGNFV